MTERRSEVVEHVRAVRRELVLLRVRRLHAARRRRRPRPVIGWWSR